jgi:hypothetical protein
MTTHHDLTDHRINRLGADLLFDEHTLAVAAAEGIDDVAVLYAGGRAGAMGDVTAPVVQAAFSFFSPEAVRDVWAQVLATGRPSDLAATYARAMAESARRRWDAAAAATVHELGERLAATVELVDLPLFAAWRAVPRPDDAVGAAALTVMTLRELRGDVHVQSVAAVGLAPLEAELCTRGPDWAALHGWPPPHPEVGHLAEAMGRADAATSARMLAIHERLSPADADELAAAVAVLHPAT